MIYMLIGAVCGILILMYLDKPGHPEKVLYSDLFALALMVICMYAAMLIQIVLHEAGHLIFGLLTGYRFSSFRIGNLMCIKLDGRIQLRKLSIAGTGGQCLMIPPDLRDGKMPVMLYNFGGSINAPEVFESTYTMLFSSGSISTEENPDGTDEPFFQGIGEFFSQDDDAVGKEIVARKLHRMSQKLLDPEEFYAFDLFEEFIFYLMTDIMKALYEQAPTRKAKENCYNKAAQDEAEAELQARFGLSKSRAKKTARQMYRIFEMGLKDDEDDNLFFWDDDYNFFWSRGFVEGIRLIKGAPGEQLGYGYQYDCEIFSDIGIKPPIRLLGSEEANRLVNEMALDEFRDEMEKLLSSLDDKLAVERVADQNGVSEGEIRESIEEVINNLWMQPVNDTKAQGDLKKAFPDGKPNVEEFIGYIAELIKKDAEDEEDMPLG